MRAILQEFHVVIGLENKDIGSAHALQSQLGGVPQVGQNSDVSVRRAEQEANGVLRIMRNTKRFNHQVFEIEGRPGREKPSGQADFELIFDGFLSRPVAIDRNAELFT